MTTTNDLPKLLDLTETFFRAVAGTLEKDPVLMQKLNGALDAQGQKQMMTDILASMVGIMICGLQGNKPADAEYQSVISVIDQFTGATLNVMTDTQASAHMPPAMKDATVAQDFDTIGAKHIAHLCRVP